MKAWRLNAAKVNERRAAGSKEAPARVQMHEQRMLDKAFPLGNGGNWLLNGLLLKMGYIKAA